MHLILTLKALAWMEVPEILNTENPFLQYKKLPFPYALFSTKIFEILNSVLIPMHLTNLKLILLHFRENTTCHLGRAMSCCSQKIGSEIKMSNPICPIPENRIGHLCKLSPMETICRTCHVLFSEKNKKKNLNYSLLKILPSMLTLKQQSFIWQVSR